MIKALKEAIRDVEALPDADQEELAQAPLTMAARKRIDAKLAKSEARGGDTARETVCEAEGSHGDYSMSREKECTRHAAGLISRMSLVPKPPLTFERHALNRTCLARAAGETK